MSDPDRTPVPDPGMIADEHGGMRACGSWEMDSRLHGGAEESAFEPHRFEWFPSEYEDV